MFTRSLITVAVVANAILGSLCMMPIANAMPVEDHTNMQNMSMMSHADCDDCPHEEHSSEKKMPCDSGHCLSAHTSEVSVSTNATLEMRMPMLASALSISAPEPILDQPSWQSITEGPPPETGINTIVLRQ